MPAKANTLNGTIHKKRFSTWKNKKPQHQTIIKLSNKAILFLAKRFNLLSIKKAITTIAISINEKSFKESTNCKKLARTNFI